MFFQTASQYIFGQEAQDVDSLIKQVNTLYQEGKYKQAIPIAKKVLEVNEEALPPDHTETATSLNRLAVLYDKMGDYARAELLSQRALAIREKVLGPNHPDTATSLNTLAEIYRKMGYYDRAEPLYQRALKIREKVLGTDHPDTATSLSTLAELYRNMGYYERAESLYQRALKIRKKVLRTDHPKTAIVLNDLAKLYSEMGDYTRAVELSQQAREIREKTLGPDHPDTAISLNNLALLYTGLGDYAKAELLCLRAREIREKVLGPDHPDTAITLNNLAILYHNMGDYARAKPLYQRAREIREKTLGPNHPDTAISLNTLAVLYHSMADYVQAESLYKRALKIRKKSLRPYHPYTAINLNGLADLYSDMGDYARAEPLYQHALEIRVKTLGTDHPGIATSYNSLAVLYHSMGDYARAEPLYQHALEIRVKTLGPDHPDTATSLNNLAELYRKMGYYDRAEPHYLRALKIREKVLGPDHPGTAISLNNLAVLYHSMGDYARAEPLYQRVLKIWKDTLGPDHPDTATSLNTLADLYSDMGDYAQAETHYQRALKIREKALGSDHPDTATSLNNLAELYRNMGDYAQAEPHYQRALKIRKNVLGPDHPDTATSFNNLASLYHSMGDYVKAEPLYQDALKIRENVLGPAHPHTANSLNNLALLYVDLEKKPEALKMAIRAQRAELKTLENILSFTSEQQRLSYQATLTPYSLFASMGSASEIALAILRYKGVVLDSLLEDRLVAEASQDPEHRNVIKQLRSSNQRLYQILMEVPMYVTEEIRARRMVEREELTREVEQLEATLAHYVAGLGRARQALSVTVEKVQQVIPKHVVLLELLRYSHYLGANKWEGRYGVSILAPTGKPKWITLGNASAIEQILRRYKREMNTKDKVNEKYFSALLKRMYRDLWAPIEKLLHNDTKSITISPDGELNFISFATLLTPDDQFLGHKYNISYVASGRDLLREVSVSPTMQMTVYANPDFSSKGVVTSKDKPVGLVAMRSLEMRDLQSINFKSLPGTARESDLLEDLAGKWDWPVRVFKETDAAEEKLRSTRSPRILHLATHGFLLPESEGESPGEKDAPRRIEDDSLKRQVILNNPMHRSGIALAGAQATLDAWKQGEVRDTSNDGIVTAVEVGGLRLKNTSLVTLSACDTGTGEARSGEGVMGLRRGFIQAGAQNLLMTLWPVSDRVTPKIMEDFYKEYHKSGNAPSALAEVQRAWLVKLRKKRGLHYAVRLAGPFIMSSQGPP